MQLVRSTLESDFDTCQPPLDQTHLPNWFELNRPPLSNRFQLEGSLPPERAHPDKLPGGTEGSPVPGRDSGSAWIPG